MATQEHVDLQQVLAWLTELNATVGAPDQPKHQAVELTAVRPATLEQTPQPHWWTCPLCQQQFAVAPHGQARS